ncbi:MAG: glycoside hydrolase family 3 protein [Chloroflexi bacterium]|nr:glycoside hydrolase family 3 protein [Chloroflexota bacterium]
MTRYPFVESLIERMSLAQKVGQMTQTERKAVSPAQVREYHLGSVLSGGGSCPGDNHPADWVDMNDAYWEASVCRGEGHPGIPTLYGVDAIHGNNNVLGATIFPHNIGLGATRDPDLVERIGRITAKEVLAAGVEWTFAPTLAVAQDPHWGRTYESYSIDPDVVASYAGRFVTGLQNDLGDDSVIACAKHWVGDGGTTHGIDQGETTLNYETLEAIHIQPYQPALDAGVLTVMVSFNSWNGTKCHGHEDLVTGLLKQKLGFGGLVISDWDGIDQLDDDYTRAVALSVNAGVDLFMVSEKWQEFILALSQLVADGIVPMRRIDDAVRRILSVKQAYGLFTKPRPRDRKWSGHESFGSVAHREVAREAVRKSAVLLKNERGLLPLKTNARILVAGRRASDSGAQCGGFTIAWQGQTGADAVPGATTIWDAVNRATPHAELSLADGTDADPGRHDVAVVVIGEVPYAEGFGDIREDDNVMVQTGSMIRGSLKTLEPYGRSMVLAELHPEELATIRNVVQRGVPVVVVMISGRPLVTDEEMKLADAFVAAWLPGSEGTGIADVLFGQTPFNGKLPFPWPTTGGVSFPVGFGL